MKNTILSTGELFAQLEDPNIAILDVRPIAAYNGWKMSGELRGGHLPGSIPLPLSWLLSLSADEQRDLLSAKGITAAKKIVIYGYGFQDSASLAMLLMGLGIAQPIIYEAGLVEWAADLALPLERLARYQHLVHPAWIKQLIAAEQTESGPDGEWLLFEVGWRGSEAYEAGHVPGAFYLETNLLEKEPLWNRLDDAALVEQLLSLGIQSDKTVILYGRDPMAAARVALILLYAGVSDVRLLDGGYAAWIRADYPVESGSNQPAPVGRFHPRGKLTFPGRPGTIIDTAEVKALLAGGEAVLVSVRSWQEYTGQVSGYTFIRARGRIPGAIWGHAGSDPNHMETYRNGDNTMRDYQEIAAAWKAGGITPEKKVIFSCSTGWRAAEAFFCAYLMNWPQITVYDGGWLEWSLDSSNPVENGEPGEEDF